MKQQLKQKVACDAFRDGKHCFHETCIKMDFAENKKICSHDNIKFCFKPYKVCCGCDKTITIKSKGLWNLAKTTKRFWKGN